MDNDIEITAAVVELACRELKMPSLRKVFRAIARDALEKGEHPVEFLSSCLRHELDGRQQSRLATNLKQARFPQARTLDAFDFTYVPDLPKAKVMALRDGHFIRDRENIVILGNSGMGKTHLAIGLGISAIEAGYRVRFISVPMLVQELLSAQAEMRLAKMLKSWDRIDLVIADELGYVALGAGGPLLFQFLSDRYEKGSVLITSNLEFSRWTEVFQDTTLTAALLDRLTHHVHILTINGESYRLRQSRARAQRGDEKATKTACI